MKHVLALSLAVAVALAGCVSEDESVPPVPPVNATFKAMFVPLGGIFPFPNDLFFSGSLDGTVNMPVQDPNDVGDYLVAMNALDGYSTTAPIVIPFNGAIDPASITAATVRLINITNPLAPVPQGFGTAFTAAVSPAVDGTTQLMITPVAPLNAKARYMVLVTIGITSGLTAVAPDTDMATLLTVHGEGVTPDGTPPPQLAAVWGAINGLFDLANAFGVTDANIAVVASFATQSTSDVMTVVNTNAVTGATPAGFTAIGTTGTLIGVASPNLANVYQSVISVPYYQSAAAATTGRWKTATGTDLTRYNAAAGPAATATLNIPIMLSTPKTAKPVAGWPTIVFQHGITGNRTNMLGLADAAAAAGFAVVAIDQPLHGLGTTHPLRIAGAERTFDLDVSNNATRAPGADGIVDASGQNYINLSSLLTSRDNLRQSAADLIRVAKSIAAVGVDGGGGPDQASPPGHIGGPTPGAVAISATINECSATVCVRMSGRPSMMKCPCVMARRSWPAPRLTAAVAKPAALVRSG